MLDSLCLNSSKGGCRCVFDLQVWHIQALVLERFFWSEPSFSFPPSLCLSRAGLSQPGLSPEQTSQIAMSKQWDQNEQHLSVTDNNHIHDYKHDRWSIFLILDSQASPVKCQADRRELVWPAAHSSHLFQGKHQKLYSPQHQLLYATSLHPFLKEWHWPNRSMRWRAAEIMSFSFPNKGSEREPWSC